MVCQAVTNEQFEQWEDEEPRVPCYYQAHPRQRWELPWGNHINRTPSASIESRQNWAVRECGILNMNHRYAPPTHEAVVKFSKIRTIPEFRDFHEKLRRQAGYFAKTRAVELAVYFVREIERNNLIHLHLLIRTSMDDPADVLGKIVQKASGTTAELAHCENIRSVAAITRYTVKDMADVQEGEREVLLFKKGLGLNLSGQFGGYFVKTKRELWKECRREWFGERYIEEWKPPEPPQRRRWQPSEEQLAADEECRQDENQDTDDQREPTPSWPLARHHRQSVMASALPVMSRVCEPVLPGGPPRNRSPTNASTSNTLEAVAGMVLACFEGAGLVRFYYRPA